MPTVSNTSPISNLAWIGQLDLLRVQFTEIWIPEAVETELQSVPDPVARRAIVEAQRGRWLKVRAPGDGPLISLLAVELDIGEAQAIALALELNAGWLLIDEREGRAMARQLGLKLTGVLGILLRAKVNKQIKAIKPEIEALRKKAGFFISPALEGTILKQAGE